MSDKPILNQFGDLTEKDFERYPVWLSVHTEDCDEPWYDETDEETFRPWLGDLPVSPQGGMYLVRAWFEFANGERHSGFLTPEHNNSNSDLSNIQPHLFLPNGKMQRFWSGIARWEKKAIQSFYKTLGKQPQEIWPITCKAEEGLTTGRASYRIPGFCSIEKRGIFGFRGKVVTKVLT